MHLYKINNDVDYVGSISDKVKGDKKVQNKVYDNYGYRDDFTPKEYMQWLNDIEKLAYSDKQNHSLLDITYIKTAFKGKRGLNKLMKRLSDFKFKTYESPSGYTYRYLVVDEVLYRQGWFLDKKFFKKDITLAVCTTKEQMKHFFDQYMDYSDDTGKEVVEAFMNAWEPGMIFKCIW